MNQLTRVLCLAAALVAPCAGPSLASAQRPTMHAIRVAEDARAATDAQLAVLKAGAADADSMVRATAVRALGRLERAALIPTIAAALNDSSATVRAEAAFALLNAAQHGGASEAQPPLLDRLRSERDPRVIAALCESLGWLTQRDAAQARITAMTLLGQSRSPSGEDAPRAVLFGIAHGLLGLARQPAARAGLPPMAIDRLQELAAWNAPSTARDDVDVRVLALMALTAGPNATERALAVALGDSAWLVRLTALRGVSRGTLTDSAAAERIARKAATDPSPMVRAAAVADYAIRFRGRADCPFYLNAATDTATTVRLAGIDALPLGCNSDAATALLDSLARQLPAPRGTDAGAWHVPAHALVALATLRPDRAAARLGAFVRSPNFFVREYAARAAARMKDSSTLRALARDPHPNVRTSAIGGLYALLGHGADALYLAQLGSDDNQLLGTAAQALAKSPDVRALPALRAAFERVTREKRETMRDSRVAMLSAIHSLSDSTQVRWFSRYLTDYDTVIAAHAAEAIGGWTGTLPQARPALLVRAPVPDESELAALAKARVTLLMADGSRIVIRLFPFEAPTNAARFARNVRRGRLDGLTIHRVVPQWLVQGASPGANEYAGWGAYSRDELALPNRRGAVGLSTRGRDTGDGQIYIDIASPFDLDHNYTVFGEVVSGMEAVDAMQEGARIRRATITR